MTRPICPVCNIRLRERNGSYIRERCTKCRRTPEQNLARAVKRRPWIVFKKDKCERCGFRPEHPCQLDVDHIDGNKKNNDVSNLMTLCANCHRLKTFRSQDWKTVVQPAIIERNNEDKIDNNR